MLLGCSRIVSGSCLVRSSPEVRTFERKKNNVRQLRRPRVVLCCSKCRPPGGNEGNASQESQGALFEAAGVIGAATAASKILGLLRELVLAAVFGVGPVVDAFGFASVVPGFFLAVLGGINGPVHLTTTATLSKLSEEEGEDLIQKVLAGALTLSVGLSLLVFILAEPIIDAFAPGLKLVAATRSLAIIQLRIMSPSIVFASLVGIGYGKLSSRGIYGIPSLSPAVSSILIICTAALYFLVYRHSGNLMIGAVSLAACSTLGSFLQWLLQNIQAPSKLRFWTNSFISDDVKKVFLMMLTSTISSGMLQIATYTDLYFASYFPRATAALGYANLLVMAPLGIISSAILIPILPLFSRLSKPSRWSQLRLHVCQTLLLCIVLTLPVASIMVPLAKPMVRLLFQRFAFDSLAVEAVSSLVVYYALGSTSYLVRDLLVRVFYALEDASTPFCISTAGIIANAILDFLFVRWAGLGPKGLVLATTLVNLFSAFGLLLLLSRKLQSLEIGKYLWSAEEFVEFAGVSSCITSVSYHFMCSMLCARSSWSRDFVCILASSFVGCASFFALGLISRGEEVASLWRLSRARMPLDS